MDARHREAVCEHRAMPLPSALVGSSTDPVHHVVDARWTMAYAAGLADHNPRYFDTTATAGIVAHPLFPVCLEWPVVLDARRLVPRDDLPPHELARGVHASHELTIDRLVRPGDVLTTTATIEGIERRRPGAYEVLRLDTVDADGIRVCRTRMGTLFLGVDVDGPDQPVPSELAPAAPGPEHAQGRARPDHATVVAIAPSAAHVYTECARIWNPIHTDPAVALAAGLPGIILHGTATLAHAVSAVVDHDLGGDPNRVLTIAGRFGAMVSLPDTLTIRIGAPTPGAPAAAAPGAGDPGAGDSAPRIPTPGDPRAGTPRPGSPPPDHRHPDRTALRVTVANGAGDLAVRAGVIEHR